MLVEQRCSVRGSEERKELYLDIGATTTLVAREDVSNDVRRIETAAFLEEPISHLRRIGADDVESVLAAVPGPLDRESGMISPPNIPEEKVNIRDLLEDHFQEVYMINDCNAGVIGEHVYGEQSSLNMVYLTISTGIGAGVIENGRALEGWKGNFGEVGHMYLGGKRRCGCGGKGHWEAYCSGRNLSGFAEELTGKRFEDAEEVFERYREGEEGLEEVMERVRRYNAAGISNLVNMYNPEIISVGGTVALNHHDLILDGMEKRIRESCINRMPEIGITSLGERSVLYGLKAVGGTGGRTDRTTILLDDLSPDI